MQAIYDWEGSFIFMIIYAAIAIILTTVYVPKTYKNHQAHQISLLKIVRDYFTLIRSKVFMSYALFSSLTYGALFSWFVIGPVLLIKNLGEPPTTFGWVTLIIGVCTCISGYMNGVLVRKYGSDKILKLGWSLMSICGILLLVGYYILGINILGAVYILIKSLLYRSK